MLISLNKDKCNIDSQILPNVEHTTFIFKNDGLFVVYEGEKRQVKRACIIGNGLHDLCCCLDNNGNATVKRTTEVDTSKILHIPKHDLLWLVLKEPIVKKYSLILEITDALREVVDKIVETFPGKISKNYFMYGGLDYGHLES